MGLVIKFCSTDRELASLLLINRESHAKVRMAVYKQALLFCQPERLKAKRIDIWRCILKLNHNTRDYSAFKQKVMNDHNLIKNVEEVIVLDV